MEVQIIEHTIYQYGKYATRALRDKAYEEITWIKRREGLNSNERGDQTLLLEVIKQDASNVRLYDYRYDMYLDEFEYIDERVGKCVLPPQDYIRTIFSLKLPYYDTKNFKQLIKQEHG